MYKFRDMFACKQILFILIALFITCPVLAEDDPTPTDLIELNQASGERVYNFEITDNVYPAESNFGTTGAGSLQINGVKNSDGTMSTVDMNQHSGFVVTNSTDITVTNVEFKNGYRYRSDGSIFYINNANAKVTLDNVKFVDNKIEYSGGGNALGSIIYIPNGTIEYINGNFENNVSIHNNANVYGGTIYNTATINEITGNFSNNGAIANHNQSGYIGAGGGFISNERGGHIGSISGIFTGNYAINATGVSSACGGAIDNYSSSTIDLISGTFIGNYAQSTEGSAYGGAILNYNATISSIKGNFQNNRVISNGTFADGGAIYNSGTINVVGDFKNNYAKTTGNSSARGGAIDNTGTIENLKGNFSKNYVSSSGTWAQGGAIYNGTGSGIKNLEGNFTKNYAISTGSEMAMGGAIETRVAITKLKGNFEGNYTQSANSNAFGGAIENRGVIGELHGSFTNNYAKTKNKEYLALGGAVFTRNDINFAADNEQNVFSGNYTSDYRGENKNAIFVMTTDTSAPTITLDAKNNGAFKFNDTISGGTLDDEWKTFEYKNQYNLKIKGDSSGKVNINNKVLNANIDHNDVTTNVNKYTYINHKENKGINSLTMNSGTLNINGSLELNKLHFQNFGMNGGTINLNNVKVDLANQKMGRITANEYSGSNKGTVNVKTMTLTSDGKKLVTPVEFADKSFKNTVKSDVKEAYTKLYKYKVSYDSSGENGNFIFERTAGGIGSYKDVNPSILPTAINNNTGAYATQMQTFNYAFQHSATFMNLSISERMAMKNANKYALNLDNNRLALTDVGTTTFSPLMTKSEDAGFWVKPYATFENIPLKRGPKVSSISYGTLIGYDTPLESIKHGWDRVFTYYIGYNGSSQRFLGIDSYDNGGLAGATLTLYKGNFFNATTISAGASVGDNHTMYGRENFTSILAGIGNKTGYNIEFKDGKFIIQPSILLSYTMVKTIDYTNAAGVRINSDPMSAIQIAPGIKFIGNTKNGWQPYLAVNMVWNIIAHSNVKANNITLPDMSIKPYVQYGLGVQKRFGERFIAFGQAMIQNGGRNGISLSFGFRWALGRGK